MALNTQARSDSAENVVTPLVKRVGCLTVVSPPALFSSALSLALPSNGNHLVLAVMRFIFIQPSSRQDGRCASLNLALAAARM
jgi:hypothetical protein